MSRKRGSGPRSNPWVTRLETKFRCKPHRTGMLLVTSLTLACGARTVAFEAPEEAEIAAAVWSSGSEVRSTTPLQELENAFELSLYEDTGEISILGWKRDALPPLPWTGGAAITPAECRGLLPPPSVLVTYDSSGAATDPARLPAFGSPDLESACGGHDFAVEINCRVGPAICPRKLSRDGCTLRVDLDACRLPLFTVGVNLDGSLACPSDCSLALTEPGSKLTLSCRDASNETCEVRFIRVPESALTLTTTRAVAPTTDVEVSSVGPLLLDTLEAGVAQNIAVSNNVVAVSAAGGPRQCLSGAGRLILLDAETLEETHNTEAPCFFRLEATDGGFAGLYRSSRGDAEMALIALDGTITSSVVVYRAQGRIVLPRAIAVAGRRVAVSLLVSSAPPEYGTALVTMDGLEIHKILELPKTTFSDVAYARDGWVVLNDSTDHLQWFDLETLELNRTLSYEPSASSFELLQVLAADDQVITAVNNRTPGVFVTEPTGQRGRATFQDVFADPTSIATNDDGVWVAGVDRAGAERRSWLTRLDLETTRLIAGATLLGRGPARIVAHGHAVFALLSWEGTVKRVETR